MTIDALPVTAKISVKTGRNTEEKGKPRHNSLHSAVSSARVFGMKIVEIVLTRFLHRRMNSLLNCPAQLIQTKTKGAASGRALQNVTKIRASDYCEHDSLTIFT